jgi:hypothetical protein
MRPVHRLLFIVAIGLALGPAITVTAAEVAFRGNLSLAVPVWDRWLLRAFLFGLPRLGRHPSDWLLALSSNAQIRRLRPSREFAHNLDLVIATSVACTFTEHDVQPISAGHRSFNRVGNSFL